MAKPALGHALGALLGESPIAKPPGPAPVSTAVTAAVAATDARERVQRVALNRIRPCPFQPRKDFSPKPSELAESIREQGIIQPLIVRERNGYLGAHRRRTPLARRPTTRLAEVPVIVRAANDREVLELALVENLQRENLNPIEEAQGYAQLIEQFRLKQEEVSDGRQDPRQRRQRPPPLGLPATMRTRVREGRLSVGHAKVILGLSSETAPAEAFQRVVKDGLTVRQTEALVARLQAGKAGTTNPVKAHSAVEPRMPTSRASRTNCASGLEQGSPALRPWPRRLGGSLLQRRRVGTHPAGVLGV